MDQFREMGFLDILGYPKYLLNPTNMAVLSFHVFREGKYLQMTVDKDRNPGYKLYNDGISKFYSIQELNTIVERNKLRKIREEMNTTKTSVSGALQTGDWMIGSITKATGVFSAAQGPARHLNEYSARKEAERLAGIDKSKKFVVLKVAGIASVSDINWE